jgi:hypothetical protein
MSMSLGNGKPQLLLDLEKQVWRTLFKMVNGGDLDNLLLDLVECISWTALAAVPEGDRQWFSLSRSSPTPLVTSTSALQLTTPSSSRLLPPHSQMTQYGAQTDMDLSPDSVQTPTLLTSLEGVEPMDTRPDGEEDPTLNDRQVPEEDVRGGKQDLAGEDSLIRMPRTRSQTNHAIQPSRTKIAMKKRQRRPGTRDSQNFMSNTEPSGGTPLGRLLSTAESYMDVDMLMRNFPITEEHQVRGLC